jgi:hypothetical protein
MLATNIANGISVQTFDFLGCTLSKHALSRLSTGLALAFSLDLDYQRANIRPGIAQTQVPHRIKIARVVHPGENALHRRIHQRYLH